MHQYPSLTHYYEFKNHRKRFIEHETIVSLLNLSISSPAKNSILVQAFTDIDSDECLALTYGDINFTECSIDIHFVLNHTINSPSHLLPCKRPRKLYVLPIVIHALQAEIDKQTIFKNINESYWTNPDNMIFTDENGNMPLLYSFRTINRNLLNSVGLETERFFAVCSGIKQDVYTHCLNSPDKQNYPFGMSNPFKDSATAYSMSTAILDTYFTNENRLILNPQSEYHEY